MKTEQILMCLFALILGMLIANMLKDVCGCNIVEGAEAGEKAEAEAAEEAARKKTAKEAAEEAARKKAAKEAARKKAAKEAAEEAARKKAAEEAARKKAAKEAAYKKTSPLDNGPVNLVDMGSFKLKCINGDIYGVLD